MKYFHSLNLIICNHWLIFDRIESIQERLCNQHRQWWSSDCMLSQNDYYRFTFNYHRRYTSVYSFPTLVLRKKRRAVAYCKRNITSNNDTNLEVMIRIILMQSLLYIFIQIVDTIGEHICCCAFCSSCYLHLISLFVIKYVCMHVRIVDI